MQSATTSKSFALESPKNCIQNGYISQTIVNQFWTIHSYTIYEIIWAKVKNQREKKTGGRREGGGERIWYLDCWPSGRFCDGFIVPPAEQATIIFAFLSNFATTAGNMNQIFSFRKQEMHDYKNAWCSKFIVVHCINSGFSSVPEKIPKNANAARLAMSHAVHSFISLYICTLIASGGWACTNSHIHQF